MYQNILNSSDITVLEGCLSAEQTVENLLDTARDNIERNITTIDAAKSLVNKLTEETGEFNGCLMTISNTIARCSNGEITPEEATAIVKPCVEKLKKRSTALSLGKLNPTSDIDECEVAIIRDFLVETKDMAIARLYDLQEDVDGDTSGDSASMDSVLSSMMIAGDVALEGSKLVNVLSKSPEMKAADKLYSHAIAMHRHGEKEKAISALSMAKGKYKALLSKVKSSTQMITVDRYQGGVGGLGSSFTAGTVDKFKTEVTDNPRANSVIMRIENKIDQCDALEAKWANKLGNASFKDFKQSLKAERKAVKQQHKIKKNEEKLQRKADKQAAKEEKRMAKITESSILFDEDIIVDSASESLILAIESHIDALEVEDYFFSAMESEGEDEGEEASSSKIRKAINKLTGAFKRKDKAELAEAQAELKEGVTEFEDEIAEAETEEEKKKLSTRSKIIMGAAAAALVAVGIINKDKIKDVIGKGDPKAAVATVKGLPNKIATAAKNLPGRIASVPENIRTKSAENKVTRAQKKYVQNTVNSDNDAYKTMMKEAKAKFNEAMSLSKKAKTQSDVDKTLKAINDAKQLIASLKNDSARERTAAELKTLSGMEIDLGKIARHTRASESFTSLHDIVLEHILDDDFEGADIILEACMYNDESSEANFFDDLF